MERQLMGQVGPNADDDITAFAHHCAYMRSVFLHGKILFEESSAEARQRMSGAAQILFGDLNRILVEYIILQACRITDAAKDMKGNDNLTIPFLMKKYNLSGDAAKQKRVVELAASIDAFRQKLLPARHKRIAHADRAAAHDVASYGKATNDEWNGFWAELRELVSTFYECVHGGPFDIDGGLMSDADGLLKALKGDACFQSLMGDSPQMARRCADIFHAIPD
jgi:hypothetical protein